MKAWADRNSTVLIICGTILVIFVLLVFIVGLGDAEGEGGVSTVTTVTSP
jgi:hypothetical protein